MGKTEKTRRKRGLPVVEAARLEALSTGKLEAANLGELLQLDFARLLATLLPAGEDVTFFVTASITQKMLVGGERLLVARGFDGVNDLANHASDMVRGMVVFALARYHAEAAPQVILEMVHPFAADAHWGVREWAWMAIRPNLVKNLQQSIALLQPWTGEADVNLRRFAVEVLRPRGVWCKHIAALRQDPALGLPLLQPMRQEPEKYAQDSVANWLNDAAKDHPDWVRAVCQSWSQELPDHPATRRIVKRAMRSIKD